LLPRPGGPTPLTAVRNFLSRYGLIIALLVLPVGFGIPRPAGRPQPRPPRREPQGRDLQRLHLGARGDRLHARLRNHRADQLRPRRRIHDRLVHLVRRLGGRWGVGLATGPLGVVGGLVVAGLVAMVGVRPAQRDDRESGLPAAEGRSEACAPDHRGGLLFHPPERRPRVAGRVATRCGRPRPRPEDLLHGGRDTHHPCGRACRGDHDSARPSAGRVRETGPASAKPCERRPRTRRRRG